MKNTGIKIVKLFEPMTLVSIVDDDSGYYIKSDESNEQLDIRFNTPREAVKYAFAESLIINLEV